MSYAGPEFHLVETVDADQLARDGGFRARTTPLLVKGAIRRWPASERWSFASLAARAERDGATVTSFQNGLVEQGTTREPLLLPVAPYLRDLDARAASSVVAPTAGLCPQPLHATLRAGERFHLAWEHLRTFVHDRPYLAQWHILRAFPDLRGDFAIRDLWPGWRWTWEYVFIGAANTVTGLHYDFPSNWFCQVRGTKEVLLFAPDQAAPLQRSRKYDWGATLSDVDITALDAQPDIAARFARASGRYARVEAGDALFIPRRTWHAVVALEPAISLAVFGLTLPEIIVRGGASETRSVMHRLGLYRRGNCTCHAMASAAKAGDVAHASTPPAPR